MHKGMVCKYAWANIGPSNVYHLLKQQVSGYENIGCMQKDLQNYHRDLKALIKDTDAHMFIDVLKNKKEADPGFFFNYQVNEEKALKECPGRTLWAEEAMPYLVISCSWRYP